jgi:hypothetical protein
MVRLAASGRFTGCAALGERLHADIREEVIGAAQLFARVQPGPPALRGARAPCEVSFATLVVFRRSDRSFGRNRSNPVKRVVRFQRAKAHAERRGGITVEGESG